MRLLATLFLLRFKISSGQVFSYPKIKTYGQRFSGFIPSGWTILDTAKGDLNNDGNDDLAFVLQYSDSASIVNFDYGELDTVVAQPRILLIAFYNSDTKQYDIITQSNTFIISSFDTNMEEPFNDISIFKGVLKIDFDIFMNSGGWGTFTNSYKFRYQNKEFKLIGADYYYINRGSGETEGKSYNFLTKKVKVSKGTISSDKMKTKWQTFPAKELKTFKTFRQPFSWKIEKDFYL